MTGPAPDAFVQAGGRSRRMGRDKAFLALGGKPLVARVLDALRPVAGRVVIVAGEPAPFARFGREVIPDRWPGSAALGGIGTALTAARTDRVLVAACDLPFVTPELFRLLLAADPAADVTLPVTDGGRRHPLCAVYSRACLPAIEARVAAGRLKVAGFFPAVRVREVGAAELAAAGLPDDVLVNLNTPGELAAARARARE